MESEPSGAPSLPCRLLFLPASRPTNRDGPRRSGEVVVPPGVMWRLGYAMLRPPAPASPSCVFGALPPAPMASSGSAESEALNPGRAPGAVCPGRGPEIERGRSLSPALPRSFSRSRDRTGDLPRLPGRVGRRDWQACRDAFLDLPPRAVRRPDRFSPSRTQPSDRPRRRSPRPSRVASPLASRRRRAGADDLPGVEPEVVCGSSSEERYWVGSDGRVVPLVAPDGAATGSAAPSAPQVVDSRLPVDAAGDGQPSELRAALSTFGAPRRLPVSKAAASLR